MDFQISLKWALNKPIRIRIEPEIDLPSHSSRHLRYTTKNNVSIAQNGTDQSWEYCSVNRHWIYHYLLGHQWRAPTGSNMTLTLHLFGQLIRPQVNRRFSRTNLTSQSQLTSDGDHHSTRRHLLETQFLIQNLSQLECFNSEISSHLPFFRHKPQL